MQRPEAYTPAPLYSRFRKATRQWSASPLSLRNEWNEHPCPQFFLTLGIVLLGVFWGVFFAVGSLSQNDIRRIGSLYSFIPGFFDPTEAADFVSLPVDRVKRLLGEPVFERQESPAVVMQYRSDACVFDLYVYQDTLPPRVKYAEIRPRSAGRTHGSGGLAQFGSGVPSGGDVMPRLRDLESLDSRPEAQALAENPETACIRAIRKSANP